MFRRLFCKIGRHGKLWHLFTIKANTQIISNGKELIIDKPIKILICPDCKTIIGRQKD